jgi:arsenate reductase-like glutaredoxin family protein
MGAEIVEQVPASRKLGEETARELAAGAAAIHIAKGRKLEVFDPGAATAEVVGKMLGSTGNLRAPTVVAGDQLLVGFNEDTYRRILG